MKKGTREAKSENQKVRIIEADCNGGKRSDAFCGKKSPNIRKRIEKKKTDATTLFDLDLVLHHFQSYPRILSLELLNIFNNHWMRLSRI